MATLMACYDDSGEREEILTYLNNNSLKYTDTLGIFVVITLPGDTMRPIETSTISMSYKGKYLDGIEFDRTPENQKSKIKLSDANPGLQSGLSLFGKNGQGTILVPSGLGYGSNPPFGIRKNAILVYDVVVFDF
ncbi:MAG: FKBP-type peptidyl-prolyl cis-trans isomerase [Saprospiraceae bacterium]